MLKAIRYLFYTELILRLRRSQEWLYPLIFFVIMISLFPLALQPDAAFLQKFIPGLIWLAALLASLLSIESVFFTDTEEGHLEQLLLSSIPLPLLLFTKLLAQWLVTEGPLILLLPFLAVIFHLSTATLCALMLSLLLGTPLLTFIASLGVALTLGLRHHSALLNLLILPLATPVLIFGVTLVEQATVGLPISGPLAFLAGLSLLAMSLLPIAIAATLRISLDD